MEEMAAGALKPAIEAASSGNIGAVLVLVLVLGALVVLALGGMLIKERGKRRDDSPPPPPSCPPPGGCQEIVRVAAELSGLTREVRADREERKEHRQEVRDSIDRIHERIDETPTRQEMVSIASVSQHAQQELSQGIAAITSLAETIRLAATRRRAPAKKKVQTS